MAAKLQTPSRLHWLGTDPFGRARSGSDPGAHNGWSRAPRAGLDPCAAPGSTITHVRGERVTQQREHLDAMTALYRRMRGALREWRDMPDGVPDGHQVCGLIEGIAIPVPARPARRPAARRR